MPLVAPADVAVRPRRSAFAAAFLSFIFPGLGHAYLGRWLRALLWAALPIIGIAAIAGLGMSYSRDDLIELVADPDFLNGVLIFLGFDLIYRLLAVFDAFRLASDRTVGNASTRILSIAGLLTLSVVIVGSHVAIARPVMFATDVYAAIEENAGDESEVLSAEELVARGGKAFELITEELTQQEAPDPQGPDDPAASSEPKPTREPTPEPTEEPTPGSGRGTGGHAQRPGLGRQGAPQRAAHRPGRRAPGRQRRQPPDGHHDHHQHRPHHRAAGLHLTAA